MDPTDPDANWNDPAQLRCVPMGLLYAQQARPVAAFSDRACTRRAAVAAVDPPCDGPPPTYAIGVFGASGFQVRRLGDVHAGALYQLGGTCRLVPASQVYYDLGALLGADDLVGVVGDAPE